MPLYILYYPSFERSLKSLGHQQKEIVKRILLALQAYYEAGVEGKLRIVIERDQSECIAILAGNHDQVKKFLASQ